MGQVLAQEKTQIWIGGAKARQSRRQQKWRDGGDDPAAKAAGEGLRRRPPGLGQILGLGQDGARPLNRLGAGGGEDDTGAIAIDHDRAQDPFQLLDAGRKGWLGDVGRLGGATERALFGEQLEIMQLAQGQGAWDQAASKESGDPQKRSTRPFWTPGRPVVRKRRAPSWPTSNCGWRAR